MSKKLKTWEDYYDLLIKYCNKYKSNYVKIDFRTKDGINYDEDGLPLGRWLYSKFGIPIKKDYKRKNLEDLGIDCNMDFPEYKWNGLYDLLYKYYKHNGNVNIGSDFKTLDGINYNEYGHNLSMWLNIQYKVTLTEEKRNKLLKLGINIEEYNLDSEWDKYYGLAVKYYNFYNDLKVSEDFSTVNGIDYSSDGFKLGAWIKFQRENSYILNTRVTKLNKIGMIWNVRKNYYNIIDLCKKYNINININKMILRKSYEEVYCKILYLLDNNLYITNSNNELNPIFFISNTNLELKYKISIDTLLNKYLYNKKYMK